MVGILNAAVLRWFGIELERAFELRPEISLSIAAKHRYDQRYWIPRWTLWRKGALIKTF